MKRTLLFLLTLALTGLGWAKPVARVQSIDGPGKLEVKEGPKASWHRAHLEMDADIGDQLRTTPDTLASLRFFLGGRANLDKGSQIKITAERDIEVVDITVTSGTFWGKFEKSKNKKVDIHTAGGVMGIRGTEFVVQVDGDDTTLSLIEGEVEVTSAKGESYYARPGSKVTFGKAGELRAILMETRETLRETAKELEAAGLIDSNWRTTLDDPEQRGALMQTIRTHRQANQTLGPNEQWAPPGTLLEDRLQAEIGAAMMEAREALFQARQELREARVELRQARREMLAAGVEMEQGLIEADRELREAGLGGLAELQGLRQRRRAIRESREQPAETGAELQTLTARPTFNWDATAGQRYAIIVVGEESEEVHWLDYAQGSQYHYPDDAQALAPGRYRYRVVPVDEDGVNSGSGLEYRFEVKGS